MCWIINFLGGGAHPWILLRRAKHYHIGFAIHLDANTIKTDHKTTTVNLHRLFVVREDGNDDGYMKGNVISR